MRVNRDTATTRENTGNSDCLIIGYRGTGIGGG
jgi:hypothetical protein